ncbi:MAG: hypothetical protein IPJ89_03180 [Candidatus Iainarchaeum archaeon]|uniref:Uncharacterized protein n=1 Tax=Candidatus Iainarchaeum sp. TaxID=3101447 RepID=A0A7T9DJ16_9ARCH|nr:MAG: hypothetical protein IPJ89_03180 [Candidatus Diapherotrites archaeon]
MQRKAQTTVELMVIMAIGLIVVASLVGFVGNQIAILQETQAQKTAQASMNELINGINEVYAQGPGAAKQVTVIWPAGIDASLSSIANKSIRLRVYKSDIVGTAIPYITGSLPTTAGTQRINIRAADGYVSVGTLTLSASPAFIYLPVARDQNSTANIQLRSTSSTSALITPTLQWNPTLVTSASDTTPFSISSAADVNRDVNVYAGPLAVGNYTGSYQVSASFSDHLESLRIPIDVEVLVDTGTLLTPYPTSLTVNTLWDDSNSGLIQLCNLGNTPIKSISFTPSTGNAGDWVQGIADIASLTGQECTDVQVTISPPNGTGLGTYYGTLVLRDFDGTNTVAIPLTVNVLGMSGAFVWDWNVAYLTNTSIIEYGMANTGSNPLNITSFTLDGWNNCDSNQNALTSIIFNGSTRFTGSSAAGVASDINDFIMPVLSYYTNNTLHFSGRINDENEQFVAALTFSDGTTYTSSVFGLGGCAADVTPPATITNLTAGTGDYPGSVLLEFTIPGDDDYSGRVADAAFRYRSGRVNDEPTWALADALFYGDFNITTGDTDVSMHVFGMPLGETWYYGGRFEDEVPHYAYTNSPSATPTDEVTITESGTQYPHFMDSNTLSSFILQNVVFSEGTFPVRNIAIAIVEDNYGQEAGTGTWLMDINFGESDEHPITFIQFDYTEFTGIEEMGYDWNTGLMNDLTPVNLMSYEENIATCESYTYQCLDLVGSLTGIVKPNTFYVTSMNGIDEFTLRFA